jgi:hypothetical protein
MKDIISTFLVISILSVGGLGLYMYNNKDDHNSSDDETYADIDNEYNKQNDVDEFFEENLKNRKQKNKIITKKNKKTDKTKRRY